MTADERADDPDDATFPHGVASFDPTTDRVLLWTRSAGSDVLSWEVATDEHLTDVVRTGQVTVDHDADHTARVDVEGLSPATTYFYRFHDGSRRSPIGRTRTLPAHGADLIRLATICCARYASAPLTVYRALSEHDVDLVLHLGDSIYEDAEESGPRPHDPPHATVTLEDYRRRHAQLRADPDARALHQRHPMVVIWDDHDLADNAWMGGAKAHDPETQGPWEARAAAAIRSHDEWLPGRLRDPDDPRVRWRSVLLGDLAELLVLDTRYIGRDQPADEDGAKPLRDPDRSMLGEAQRAWAHERLADTSRPWAVVASQVVMNRMVLSVPHALDASEIIPSGYGVIDGELLRTDQWDGYPAEREALLAAMAQRGKGVVVLSGDVHSSWAFEGPCGTDDRPVTVEFTCPSTASTPMGRQVGVGGGLAGRLLDALPNVRFADLVNHGYTTVEIRRETVRSDWWFVDPGDPTAETRPGAAWETHHGVPGQLTTVGPPGDRPTAGDPPFDAVPTPARHPHVGRRRSRRQRALRAFVVVAAVVLEHMFRVGRTG